MFSNKLRLFFMMILEIAIWGAWQIKIFPYMGMLGFTAGQQAWVGSAFGIASVVGIFFSNQFADRNFSAERFLAFSHVIGGAALIATAFVTSFPAFFTLFLVYAFLILAGIGIAPKGRPPAASVSGTGHDHSTESSTVDRISMSGAGPNPFWWNV